MLPEHAAVVGGNAVVLDWETNANGTDTATTFARFQCLFTCDSLVLGRCFQIRATVAAHLKRRRHSKSSPAKRATRVAQTSGDIHSRSFGISLPTSARTMKLAGRVALLATLVLALRANCHAQANVIQVALTKMARSSEVDWLRSRYRNALSAAEKVNFADNNSTTTSSASANSTTTQVVNANAAETRIFSGEGSHTIQVTVGGQPRTLIIDTGSGKTAFVCEGCTSCGTRHENTPFQFTANTKYLTCASANSCAECTAEGKCKYSQVYVEGDYWLANKVSDVMAFAPKNQPAF